MKMFFVVPALLAIFLATPVFALVKTTGNGDSLNFDIQPIPTDLRPSFALMNKKCTQCHSMEIIVMAVLSGKCPETRQPFDKQTVKAYGIKMIRKKDSNINKKEMRDIVVLLNHLLDVQAKK